MKAILGIDVSKDKLDVVVVIEGRQTQHKQVKNNRNGLKELKGWLEKQGVTEVHAAMEATNRYGEAAAHFLFQQGYAVSILNPAQIKAYGKSQLRRNKTDKLDASLIADFCRTQNPPLWTPPDPAWQQLRELVRHLEDLTEDCQRQRNRLDALAHAVPAAPDAVLRQLKDLIAFLNKQIAQVKKDIDQHLNQHPHLKNQADLLTSIPGIGPLTAGKLLAEFRSMTDFPSVRQLVAFGGLNPAVRQSGKFAGQAKMSKQGRASIRAALYMPAVVAKNHNPLLMAFAQRLAQQGLNNMQILGAIMRKLLHLVYGILKSGRPFDPHFNQNSLLTA